MGNIEVLTPNRDLIKNPIIDACRLNNNKDKIQLVINNEDNEEEDIEIFLTSKAGIIESQFYHISKHTKRLVEVQIRKHPEKAMEELQVFFLEKEIKCQLVVESLEDIKFHLKSNLTQTLYTNIIKNSTMDRILDNVKLPRITDVLNQVLNPIRWISNLVNLIKMDPTTWIYVIIIILVTIISFILVGSIIGLMNYFYNYFKWILYPIKLVYRWLRPIKEQVKVRPEEYMSNKELTDRL